MSKPMTAFTTDFQHSGMVAKDLDETIAFYTEKLGFEVAGIFHNGENRCAFLRYGHLTIETWEGEPAPMTRRCHQPLGFRHPGHRSGLRKRQGTRPEVQGHRDPAHRQLLGARHPLLQRVRSERRDHRVLPDRLIVRLIKTRGVPIPQQRDGNAPRLCVCVCIRVFRAYANTYCACAVTLPCCRRP